MSQTIANKLELKGYLKDYMDYATDLTDACKEFHLGVALTCLSSCVGSKVTYPDYGGDTKWPNLYTLLLGASGISRKTTCVKMGRKLVNEVDHFLIGDGIETREKFINYLQGQPNILWPIFEFSSVLAGWQSSYAKGFKDFVTDVFDPMEERHRRIMGNRESNTPSSITVERASVNILAGSTIEWLKEQLTEGDLRGGLMGRFLIFPHTVKEKDPGLQAVENKAKKDKIVNYLKKIYNMPYRSWVDISQVNAEFNAWDRKIQKKLVAEYNPDIVGFQSRTVSHTLKLAVLICVSESPEPQPKYVLTSEQLHKAILLGNWLLEQTVELAEKGFTKNKVGDRIQKFLQLANREDGIRRSEALRLMNMLKVEFDRIVYTCIEQGSIRILKDKGETNRTKVYYKYVEAPDKSEASKSVDDIF